MLLAPGGRGVVNAINQLPEEWRNIALLDRLTQGRVGGPTPLGVQAVGAANAFQMMRGMGLGEGFLNTPTAQQQVRGAQMQQQAGIVQDAEKYVNDNFAWDSNTWLPGSPYTSAEQQATVEYLMAKYGPPNGPMTLAGAQAIVDAIAARKPRDVNPGAAAPPSLDMAPGADGGGASF
jgi:hypothetical protein